MSLFRYGLVDGPSWVIHALLVAARKLGDRATEDDLFKWACRRLFEQCAHWVKRMHLDTALVAFDSADCWRRDIAEQYKSTRKRGERDPRIAPAYGRIVRDFLGQQGLTLLRQPQCEAEDVLFHARNFLRKAHRGAEFVVLTRDSDLFQMVDVAGDTVVLDFWGRFPEQSLHGQDILWKKILSGDPSDNIRGIREWKRIPADVRQRLLNDPQYRRFWLEERPALAETIRRNKQLIDLSCCPQHIQQQLQTLCETVLPRELGHLEAVCA